MIFPWVCMSVDKRQSFSDLINKCYSSSTAYLSVEEERIFTKHAIEIVIESQSKKLAIYAKRNEGLGSHLTSRAETDCKSRTAQTTQNQRTAQKSKPTSKGLTTREHIRLPGQRTLNTDNSQTQRTLHSNQSQTRKVKLEPMPKVQTARTMGGGGAVVDFNFFTEVRGSEPNQSKLM